MQDPLSAMLEKFAEANPEKRFRWINPDLVTLPGDLKFQAVLDPETGEPIVYAGLILSWMPEDLYDETYRKPNMRRSQALTAAPQVAKPSQPAGGLKFKGVVIRRGGCIFPKAFIFILTHELLTDLEYLKRASPLCPYPRIPVGGRIVLTDYDLRCVGHDDGRRWTLFVRANFGHYQIARAALWLLGKARRVKWAVGHEEQFWPQLAFWRKPTYNSLAALEAELGKEQSK
jgi:hypothetical protein